MHLSTASNAPTSATLPTLRFCTGQFNARERVPAWREFVGHTFCKVDIEPLSPEGFTGTTVMRLLPGLGVISGDCSPLSYIQTRALSDSDDAILTLASGPWELRHAGRTHAFAAGDAVLTSAAGLSSYALYSGGPHWGLRAPLALLSPYIAGIEDTFGRRIPAQTPAMRLLRHYLGMVEALDQTDPRGVAVHAAGHMRDLIALAVGATRDGAAMADAHGARAARLHAVKSDIVDRLGSATLSIDDVAARHRLPVRYIQRLFEADGTTFTDFVLGERILRAHRMLTDLRYADRAISTIAFDCGFRTLSYFNQSFRRCYGASPSDVRAQARPAGRMP